jgi:hypothetical protein
MPDISVIKELFVILMILTDGDSVASVNHATANDDLNIFETQKKCEAALPEFVSSTYPEFNPRANLFDHQIVMNGDANSPVGRRSATWRCASIFVRSPE